MARAPTWSGFLYDGRTADRQQVTVSLEPDAGGGGGGVRVTLPDGSSALWPIGELRQTQGSFSSEMLRLEYGSEPVQALFVEQKGFTEALLRAFPGVNKTLRRTRNTGRIIGISVGAAAAAALTYVLFANPAADWLAKRTPPAWERALGQDVAERMAPADRQCVDSAGLASVRGVLGRLVAAGPATPYTFQLVVLRDSSINAFAAPGGYIAVNGGLIDAAKSPDELAGVLAHEAQHVLHRHTTRAIIREAPLRLALSLMFDGTGIEGFAAVVSNLGVLSYRRSDEAEADRDGMRLLQAAQVDGNAMVSFMRTLSREHADAPRLVSYLSSHPHTQDRISALETVAQQGNAATVPLMTDAEWARVKSMCDAPGSGAK